jgi:hypothetical protein
MYQATDDIEADKTFDEFEADWGQKNLWLDNNC